MAPIPVFGLLTDFGFDFAVASMKALIVKSLPQSQIIDIEHTVPKFSIVSGSFIIDKVHRYFPHGTIFVCIIDPGVGSAREALCIETEHYTFFGPNNGLFHTITDKTKHSLYEINQEIIKPETYTFHGRDLFIPAAIAYARGQRDFLTLLTPDKLVTLENKGDCIAHIDSFGNIKTTIRVDEPFEHCTMLSLFINGKTITCPFVKTFSDTAPGTLLCYKGSNETLEIAVNLGSAQNYLQVNVGDAVIVSCS